MKLSQKFTIPLAAFALITAGAATTIAYQSHAQTQGNDSPGQQPTTTQNNQQHQFDPTKGGHVGQNGVKEELLTGDTASKVTAAAQAAQPGATIERIETDAEGAAYEAHMVKSDGTHITLKFDNNFNVTATEDGLGGRDHGQQMN